METEIDSSGIVRANASKIPAKLEERLFSQIDSIKSPRLLLPEEASVTRWSRSEKRVVPVGQETLYTNRNIAKLQTLASNVKRYSPLQPREAFVGGRTKHFVTKWSRTLENESFCYVDVCSLYPYVNSRYLYPFGHPDEIYLATEQRCQTPYRDSVDSDRHLPNSEQSSGGGTKSRSAIYGSDGPTIFFLGTSGANFETEQCR